MTKGFKMATYLVCVDGDQDCIDDAKEVTADSLQDAAEEYVRLNFASLDYPEETEVWVKRKGVKANPVKHAVATLHEVRFRAKEVV
jgi:hypothetical protein